MGEFIMQGKRYLDCSTSELMSLSPKNILDSIKGCEGRIIVSETIGTVQPILHDITNAEFAASQGADILILNKFDVHNPCIMGMPTTTSAEIIRHLKKLTGRLVGINLEPIDHNISDNDFWKVTQGRIASVDNAKLAVEMGVNFIVITSNPGNKISNVELCESLHKIKSAVGDKVILITGKMHAGGLLDEAGETLITKANIENFIKNGADIIMMPAPGTVPGSSVESISKLISYTHSLGAMAMTTIGTSQEGSEVETIRQIALMAKMTGTDLHHIGDSGYLGMALPENIFTYSLTIRGRRHTYSRIAKSILR